jgi:O-antigen ligase
MVLLLGSQSKTALVVLVLLILGWGVWSWLGRIIDRQWQRRVFFLLLILALGILTITLPFVMDSLGKDMTLTGRTEIWVFAFLAGLKHPFLGVGYGVFWQPKGTLNLDVVRFAGPNPHTHNAFFDLWLDMGFLGLGGAVFFLTKLFTRAQQILGNAHRKAFHSCVWIGLWVLASNLTETGLFSGGFQWITLIAFFDYANPEFIAYKPLRS